MQFIDRETNVQLDNLDLKYGQTWVYCLTLYQYGANQIRRDPLADPGICMIIWRIGSILRCLIPASNTWGEGGSNPQVCHDSLALATLTFGEY